MIAVIMGLLAPIWKYLAVTVGALIGGVLLHRAVTKTDSATPAVKAAETQSRIAKAEADAPSSVTAVQDRLEKGNF